MWVRALCIDRRVNERDEYLDAIRDAVEFLLTCRPSDRTFHCRDVAGKDSCNGLIGQAYPLIALSLAADHLGEDRYRAHASDVFLTHPYDDRTGIWQRVEIDGTVLSIDRTFNHQLWFAVAGSFLSSVDAIDEQIVDFLEALETMMNVDDGLIEHRLRPTYSPKTYAGFLAHPVRRHLLINKILHYVRPPSSRQALRDKARNYQSVNLMGLAMLKREYPNHPVWKHPKINSAIELVRTDDYRRRMETNGHGFVNKPTGLQNAVALETFDVGTDTEVKYWITEQFRRSYDTETGFMERGATDPETMAGNMYIAGYLPDTKLDIDRVTDRPGYNGVIETDG